MVKEVPIEFKLVNLKIEGWQLLLDFSLDYSVSADNISLLAVNRKTKAELPAFEKDRQRKSNISCGTSFRCSF